MSAVKAVPGFACEDGNKIDEIERVDVPPLITPTSEAARLGGLFTSTKALRSRANKIQQPDGSPLSLTDAARRRRTPRNMWHAVRTRTTRTRRRVNAVRPTCTLKSGGGEQHRRRATGGGRDVNRRRPRRPWRVSFSFRCRGPGGDLGGPNTQGGSGRQPPPPGRGMHVQSCAGRAVRLRGMPWRFPFPAANIYTLGVRVEEYTEPHGYRDRYGYPDGIGGGFSYTPAGFLATGAATDTHRHTLAVDFVQHHRTQHATTGHDRARHVWHLVAMMRRACTVATHTDTLMTEYYTAKDAARVYLARI